ncbi:alpha/beta hydrolase-fold protein [Corynebacterium pseudodiphtheriticum]|uniref:alpha/beta hydrolase-fold protein n=1 Tax=Corynebacterium pseudodiphtheriticum TaxID=37637 RepID=UPI00254CA764|nr:alpha/beta hydrolase-fold protein [Corynebacterium pseudodiphtheriticum]MDK8552112.1 alpha/beta hydrolase-fold protein [Corynebacterium pseudodiphtheriticum]
MNVLPGNEDQLRQELTPAVGDPAALQQAWERIAAGGFPRRSTDGQSYVFAVRYSELQAMTTQSLPTLAEQRKSGVHLHINRLTDKLKYELGMMNHLPGTDIWTLTVEVSQHYQGSYGFQLTHGQRTPTMCDPHAIRTLWNEDGFGLSEISQPLAVSNTAMQVRKTHCAGVDVLVYLPGKGSRAGLLTLFDGEKWCKTNLHACISAINEEAELPFAAVLICNDSNSQRVQRLGLDADFLAAVCTQVQDHVVKLMGELGVEFVPEQSILAGQSLGGLAALYIAQNHPNAFRELIVQSPSLWWKPNKTAVPTDNNLQNSSWITEQFSRQPAMPRLRIDVGAREDVGVAKAHLLARKLSDCGWPHQLEVYEGGHDHVAWRAQLVAHLREIASSPA